MAIKEIKKPSDNELREQINKSYNFKIFFLLLCLVSMLGYLITGLEKWLFPTFGFFLLYAFVEVMLTQDKIRLEIRELKKED